MLVKGKLQEKPRPFQEPIYAFRKALRLSQEAAAKRVGVSTYTWASWEQGKASPRPAQLSAIAGLTDSPGLRMKFWLDIYVEGIKLGAPSQKPMTPRETVMLGYINQSVMALRDLCLAAAEGSTSSEELLKDAADKLVRAAGDARHQRELKGGAISKGRRK